MEPVGFRDMVYVISVYEEKSFSRAAERCFISQPSLSKAVKKIENNLGCVIFDRGSTPVEVTPDGKTIISYFQKMMDLQKKLEVYCQGAQWQRKTDLVIGAPSFFCTCMLPPVVASFQLDHPNCHIKIIESNDSDLKKFLKSGIVDIGLSVEEDMPAELEAVDLKQESIILAVPGEFEINQGLEAFALTQDELSSGHFSREKAKGLPIERFSRERFLLLKRGNDLYRRSMAICRDAGFEPLVVMELDQLLTTYYLATAGEGVAFIRSSIPHYIGGWDKLRFYRIDHPATTRVIRLFYDGGRTLTLQQKTFVEYLKAYPLPG